MTEPTGEKRNWKELILPDYEIRKTKAQKTAFIEMLRGVYGERMHVEEAKGGIGSRNIVLGDPDSAEVIYTAHYDTCAVLPFPNFITPKNIAVYLIYQIFFSLLLILPVFLLEGFAIWLTDFLGAPDFVSFLVTELTLVGGMTALLWLLLAGPANRHTANDNTSGVVTVLTLADRLADSANAAFVLFDHEEVGLFGSAAFAKEHPELKKNGRIVNFDCVSDGDTLMILFPKKEDGELRRKLESLAGTVGEKYGKTVELCGKRGVFYPSDQANFRHGVGVAALKTSKLVGLYMDRIHTAKDTVFDESNIEALAELFGTLDRM